jgi:Do/DeqQ family serine protease
MKRGGLLLAAVLAGFVGGLIGMAWFTTAEPTSAAAPQTTAPPPRGPVAAQGLPDLTGVADRAVKAAANISSTQVVRTPNSPFARDPFFEYFFGNQNPFGDSLRQAQSLGSGVIVSADGYVLTNNHVLGEAGASIKVTLPDNRELPARVIGTDQMTDLAVVKVDATGLTPLPWGDSSKLKMAEWVLAIGNPFALNHSVTFGIVSAVSRPSPDLSVYTDFIQTDAAINPGNSGGALINTRGELIGINSAIYSETGGYQGIGFAIPANLARRIMDELIKNGEVKWGSIEGVGFRPITPDLLRQVEISATRGVIVFEIFRNSEAYAAGLRPGDVVVAFNDRPIDDITQFMRLLADSPIGSRAKLGISRGSRPVTIEVPIVSAQPRRRR